MSLPLYGECPLCNVTTPAPRQRTLAEIAAGKRWGVFGGVPLFAADFASDRAVIIARFTFTTPDGEVHEARPGLVTDGISYPWWALPIVRGRFVGRSRFSSFIHDQLCYLGRYGLAPVDSARAHYVFYLGMRAARVNPLGAWIRYQVVRLAGPKFKARERLDVQDDAPTQFPPHSLT